MRYRLAAAVAAFVLGAVGIYTTSARAQAPAAPGVFFTVNYADGKSTLCVSRAGVDNIVAASAMNGVYKIIDVASEMKQRPAGKYYVNVLNIGTITPGC